MYKAKKFIQLGIERKSPTSSGLILYHNMTEEMEVGTWKTDQTKGVDPLYEKLLLQ